MSVDKCVTTSNQLNTKSGIQSNHKIEKIENKNNVIKTSEITKKFTSMRRFRGWEKLQNKAIIQINSSRTH